MSSRLRTILLAGAVLGLATPAFALGLWGGRRPAPPPASEALGVEVVSLRRTAGGHLLDLRYRVVDAAKAAALLDRTRPMELVQAGSGTKLPVLGTRLGPMRQTTMRPEAGRVYFAMFANPKPALKPGQKLSLKVGDAEISGIGLEE